MLGGVFKLLGSPPLTQLAFKEGFPSTWVLISGMHINKIFKLLS